MHIQFIRRRTGRRETRNALLLVGVSLLSFATGVTAVAASAKPVPVKAASAVLTPEARAALTAMGAYLRSLKSFEVTAEGTGDQVTLTGQTIEYGAQLHYSVVLPDRMYAEISTGSRVRELFYDGLKLTISAPDTGYYADAPLNGSLGVLLERASTEYDIDLPLHQLFRWGDAARPTAWPSSGYKVGTAHCGKATCDQYAFRQPGLDWQLWIEQGAKPLPVRVVYTGTLDKARPQIAANLAWTANPAIPATRFAFTPTDGASRIAIKKSTPAGGK